MGDKCTWYLILKLLYFIIFKYCYYLFTVSSLMLELGTSPENIRNVCNLSEQNDAKFIKKQEVN